VDEIGVLVLSLFKPRPQERVGRIEHVHAWPSLVAGLAVVSLALGYPYSGDCLRSRLDDTWPFPGLPAACRR
jgi:hypothetical protein